MNVAQAAITVEVSPGELLDRLCIVRIKSERVVELTKLANIRCECARLEEARRRCVPATPAVEEIEAALRAVNERLWDLEEFVRSCEREHEFGPLFIEAARSIYRLNDVRASLKRQANLILNSPILEEKSFAPVKLGQRSLITD